MGASSEKCVISEKKHEKTVLTPPVLQCSSKNLAGKIPGVDLHGSLDVSDECAHRPLYMASQPTQRVTLT